MTSDATRSSVVDFLINKAYIASRNGLGFLGRRRAPGSPGALLLSRKDLQPVGLQLRLKKVERPVGLQRTKDLEPDGSRHQIGELKP